MAKIHEIVKDEPHTVSEVICIKCGRRWVAVRHCDVRLKQLECEMCGQGYVIETGENLDKLEDK